LLYTLPHYRAGVNRFFYINIVSIMIP